MQISVRPSERVLWSSGEQWSTATGAVYLATFAAVQWPQRLVPLLLSLPLSLSLSLSLCVCLSVSLEIYVDRYNLSCSLTPQEVTGQDFGSPDEPLPSFLVDKLVLVGDANTPPLHARPRHRGDEFGKT